MQEANSKRPNLDHDVKTIVQNSDKNLITFSKQTPVEEVRKHYEEEQSQFHYELTEDFKDIEVPFETDKKIPVRIVRPKDNHDKLPIILYFHGGGWVYGSKETYARVINEIAKNTKSAVVFPSYSLSPEVKYPTAVNECYEVLKYISQLSEEHNLDTNKIIVTGDSAGANLAAATALMSKEKKGPKLLMQLLMCPVTDLNLATDTIQLFNDGPGLTKEKIKWFRRQYLVNKGQRDDIYASPLIADYPVLAGLPYTFIITAENDVLRDDGEAYARRLNKAGVPVSCVRYNGTIHNFIANNALAGTKTSIAGMNQVCAVLNKLLNNI